MSSLNKSFQKETTNRFPFPLGCVLYPVLGLFVLGTAGYLYLQNANYHSAIEATKEWAQLSDFPSSATNLSVKTQGSMFTREFTVEFNAPIADVEKWLNESPGTKGVTPAIDGKIRIYDIEPGGGAQHAELELDESTGRVRINTYWS